jgi:hypothetical protein
MIREVIEELLRERRAVDYRDTQQCRRQAEAAIAARAGRRNAAETTVDWRFTTDDARIELKCLSPSLQT